VWRRLLTELTKRVFGVLLAVLLLSFWGGGPALAQPADIQGHWAERQISGWFAKGLVSGYGDGTFRPDNKVTRAEFVVMTNRAFGFTGGIQAPFSDVSPGDWFFGQVCAAVAAGYIAGDEDGRFRPGDEISRQEAAVVLSRLLKLKMPEGGDVLAAFKDAGSIPQWSQAAVRAVVAAGYMAGYPEDSTFRPAEPITRAEAVVVLDRAKTAHEQNTAAGGAAVPGAGAAVSVARPLADRSMTVGGRELVVDLAGVFSSTGGASLTYSASSSNAGVAAVGVSGSTLTVSAVSAGSAVITVTASNGVSGSASDEFTVTVSAAAPGGGGGGASPATGSSSEEGAPKIEGASIVVGGRRLEVEIDESGLNGTIDLSSWPGSAVITEGTISVSEAAKLTLSVQVGEKTVTKVQNLKAGENRLEAMDVIKKYGLSLNLVELFLGDPVVLTGTLEGGNGEDVPVSLTIDLP